MLFGSNNMSDKSDIFSTYRLELEGIESDHRCTKCKYNCYVKGEKYWCINIDCKQYAVVHKTHVE